MSPNQAMSILTLSPHPDSADMLLSLTLTPTLPLNLTFRLGTGVVALKWRPSCYGSAENHHVALKLHSAVAAGHMLQFVC